jgi:hypothetical protein
MDNDKINQTRCWISSSGHIWMVGSFDTLPLSVRRRLRSSPFNLCAACLTTKFMPKARAQHPEYSREKALLAGIEMMEAEVRNERKGGRLS